MYSAYDTLAGGLPHSDIHGSTPARGSPWLFAACHVLHRLLVPRHPPNALLILDSPDIAPKSDTSPCTETILRLSCQGSVVSCQKQPRSKPSTARRQSWKYLCFPQHNTIPPNGHITDRSHGRSRIHLIGSFIAPLNPRYPDMGASTSRRNIPVRHMAAQRAWISRQFSAVSSQTEAHASDKNQRQPKSTRVQRRTRT
jgi:hypothetical protein